MTAQEQLIQKYGLPDAPNYQTKYCTIWEVKKEFPWFPAKRFLVNMEFKKMLSIAFEHLEDAKLHTEIETYDGCYNNRMVRGRKTVSIHGWAGALDLNAEIERLGQRETHWSPEFIQIMRDAQIFWGGDFHTRPDNMHFAMVNG